MIGPLEESALCRISGLSMTWVVSSILTALCESLKDVFSKKGLADIDEYVIAWSLRFSLCRSCCRFCSLLKRRL
jgi:uncharacterized membrane protein